MIVFVHGVPETHRIWRKVQDRIDRPSVAVSLPGFGCPRPDGFAATKDAYVDWLVAQLTAIVSSPTWAKLVPPPASIASEVGGSH